MRTNAQMTVLLPVKFCRSCSKRAFTIMEVVIASVLLIVAIVPILKALTSAHLNSIRIEKKTMSVVLAQSELEKLRAKALRDYSQSFSNSSYQIDDSYYGKVADTAVNSNLRNVVVSVGCDNSGNHSLESGEILVSLHTLIANRW